MNKPCIKCSQPIEPDNPRVKYHDYRCRSCFREYRREMQRAKRALLPPREPRPARGPREKRPRGYRPDSLSVEERARYNRRYIYKKYGINLDQYEAMLSRQGGKCAICRLAPLPGKRSLAVDHCHATGLVRGLLCHKCNVGLGCFRDDVDLFLTAVSYLSKTAFTQEEF